MNDIIKGICKALGILLEDTKGLSGGDINQVFKISTKSTSYVLKINLRLDFAEMFQIEAKSLNILRATESFAVPKVISTGYFDKYQYILLEYMATDAYPSYTNSSFAKALSELHANNAEIFGLEFDNYIGSLHQTNTQTYDKSSDFFINLRLEPQFRLASMNGFHFARIDHLYKAFELSLPEDKPSLIHGDLWNGNCIYTLNAKVCIIDPAICYASREMDIAMMKLFGGFSSEVFEIYNEILPLECYWEDRLQMWQLYYLLVHLNIFGKSYYNAVNHIVKRYSS